MRQRYRRRKPKRKTKMKQDFFTNLPSEIIIDILSRLPVRAIISCKFVCKPWLNLLKTDEFAKSHLSKSVPGLVVNGDKCKIFDFDDVLNLEHHEHHYSPVTGFDCSECGTIAGSANGLIFLSNTDMEDLWSEYLMVINPITREYIQIPDPQKLACGYHQEFTYGFGASKRTGQHKLVRIFHNYKSDEEINDFSFPGSEAQVYTLGTRLWRSIIPGPLLEYNCCCFGAFLNGNIYWLVFDSNGCSWISCCELDDEVFSIFPSPPALPAHSKHLLRFIALEDCLCISDNVSDDEFIIWMLKDSGVEKSWTKDFIISKRQIPNFRRDAVGHVAYPVKVFKDGDILMAWGGLCLFYYSTKSKTGHEIDIFERDIDSILHTSSFVSLKSYVMERVRSFRYKPLLNYISPSNKKQQIISQRNGNGGELYPSAPSNIENTSYTRHREGAGGRAAELILGLAEKGDEHQEVQELGWHDETTALRADVDRYKAGESAAVHAGPIR
ncbi:hypothetical protein C2S51_001649 [Perilla frutescens var. frutescens]|nr:hypothetical protein C2S51_001649 [Perilla frutescens var. frutescens]